jgi:divalent metal cation (Fe/Co/Zn/Cd) transporter
MLGLIAAMLGIFLAHRFQNPYFDGAASIVIGLILATVAFLIGYESKGLLVGEGADPEILRSIKGLAEADPAVKTVERPLTMHFGPHTVLLTLNVRFHDDLSERDRESALERLENVIRSKHKTIKHVFIEAISMSENKPGELLVRESENLRLQKEPRL